MCVSVCVCEKGECVGVCERESEREMELSVCVSEYVEREREAAGADTVPVLIHYGGEAVQTEG